MASMEADLEKALADLRLYDLAIDLHGSRALDIAQPDSDVNVIITRPLQGLLNELEESQQTLFRHVGWTPCTPPWFLAPRLLLLHVKTDIQLDLIGRWSADIFVRERDVVTNVCMAKDDRVKPFLELVGKWARGRKGFMPEDEGFPNSYCFRLIGLHFLMLRMVGVVLPPLTAIGSFLNDKEERYMAAKKDTAMQADDLVVEFLQHLGKAGKPERGLWANLRIPTEPGPPGVWQVLDPPSHKKLLGAKGLPTFQIREISKMAKMDAKALDGNKAFLDSL